MDTARVSPTPPTARCTRPRAPPDRSSGSWWQSRFRKWTPLCPTRWRRESLPALRILQFESRLAAYALHLFRFFNVALAQHFHILRAHHRLIVGTVTVHKLSHDNLAIEGEAYVAGGRSVFDLALLLVILHGVQAVAHLVAPLVKRRTWRNDFDERESFFLEGLADRPRQLPHVEGGPARDINRARRLHQVRQVERRLERAVRMGGGSRVARSRRRRLPARHCIDQVVYADDLQVDIAPRRMHQVIPSNRGKIAITH